MYTTAAGYCFLEFYNYFAAPLAVLRRYHYNRKQKGQQPRTAAGDGWKWLAWILGE